MENNKIFPYKSLHPRAYNYRLLGNKHNLWAYKKITHNNEVYIPISTIRLDLDIPHSGITPSRIGGVNPGFIGKYLLCIPRHDNIFNQLVADLGTVGSIRGLSGPTTIKQVESYLKPLVSSFQTFLRKAPSIDSALVNCIHYNSHPVKDVCSVNRESLFSIQGNVRDLTDKGVIRNFKYNNAAYVFSRYDDSFQRYLPMYCLLVKEKYLAYFKTCLALNVEPNPSIFLFTIDKQFDSQSNPDKYVRGQFRKTIKHQMATANIPILTVDNLFSYLTKLPKKPTGLASISAHQDWLLSLTNEFVKEFPVLDTLQQRDYITLEA